MMKTNVSACVIGAGCSGITAVKNLVQAGVEKVVCYEQNHRIGGNWVFSEKESHSSVCETTHIISSKTLSQYMDFPMPDHYPDYPSHEQVLAYFDDYVDHFDLKSHIRFNSAVDKVEKIDNNRWRVQLKTGESEEFDYLFVSNGHHSVPRHPDFKDAFTGRYLHSHSYKTNKSFKDERVLIVGSGNSGCDCAVEISRVAKKVAISMRRPHYIIPKFFLGKPTDTFAKSLLWLPRPIIKILQKVTLRIQVGRYEDYGLELPNYEPVKSHPTLNSELLYKIRHGKVQPRKGIEKIEGKKVYFKNGEVEEFDTLVAATGYKIATPFFDKDFINYEEADRIPLFLRMFHPEHPSLIFIGLFQPQGAIWPLSDYQAKLAASYVTGRWKMPENIRELAEKDSDFISREFIQSKRHTIEVHYHRFLIQLKKQIPAEAPAWSSKKVEKPVKTEVF